MALRPIRILASRFWDKVAIRGQDECWRWMASLDKHGYGRFRIGGRGSSQIGAHRMAFVLDKGTVPNGLDVCHSCDNPPCCNPKHLFSGTRRVNMQDASEKGRLVRKSKYPSEQARIEARRERQRVYKASPKGKASISRWNNSDGHKAAIERYKGKSNVS